MKKKLVALSAATLMLVGMFPAFSYAEETPINFSFILVTDYAQQKASSTNREKITDSSEYMYCSSCSTTSTITSGINSTYNGKAYAAESKTGSLIDCVYNGKTAPTYSFSAGKSNAMINYVKEGKADGYDYTNILCVAPKYTYQVKFTGIWQPDL